jgi:voltage-gated potassium channel
VAVYVAGGAGLLATCGALAVLDAERANPDANILNFSDAIWSATLASWLVEHVSIAENQ